MFNIHTLSINKENIIFNLGGFSIYDLDEWNKLIQAQGVESEHVAYKCPECGKVQSLYDLMEASDASSATEMIRHVGYSCTGLFQGLGPYRSESNQGAGCNFSFDDHKKLRRVLVRDTDGNMTPKFELTNEADAKIAREKSLHRERWRVLNGTPGILPLLREKKSTEPVGVSVESKITVNKIRFDAADKLEDNIPLLNKKVDESIHDSEKNNHDKIDLVLNGINLHSLNAHDEDSEMTSDIGESEIQPKVEQEKPKSIFIDQEKLRLRTEESDRFAEKIELEIQNSIKRTADKKTSDILKSHQKPKSITDDFDIPSLGSYLKKKVTATKSGRGSRGIG